MKKNPTSKSGLFNPRVILAFSLCSGGVLLAIFSFAGIPWHPINSKAQDGPAKADLRERYMPVPGGRPDDLDRMETEWNNRLTYPTGVFNPAWLRLAAAKDALIPRGIPAGLPFNLKNTASPLALTITGFTALGPQPERMTGCTLCFDYTTTEGRVNDIVVDPTTTTPGSIVAYLGSVGGGVWKTTNCCTSATSWSVVTDNPLLATISIDTLTIDPNNHNTIYAGTGDLNYGSFSMGSQGILKSTDAGATWTLLGAMFSARACRSRQDSSRNTSRSVKCASIPETATTSWLEPRPVSTSRTTVETTGLARARPTISARKGRTSPALR